MAGDTRRPCNHDLDANNMTLLKKKPKIEANQDIVNDYIDDGQPWPAERRTIAAWAIRKRRWQPSQKEMIVGAAQELAEAMRSEMEMDPQGRTVRAKHCALITERDQAGNKVQKRLWFDRSSSTPELMRLALQQRRRKVLGECKQLQERFGFVQRQQYRWCLHPNELQFRVRPRRTGTGHDVQSAEKTGRSRLIFRQPATTPNGERTTMKIPRLVRQPDGTLVPMLVRQPDGTLVPAVVDCPPPWKPPRTKRTFPLFRPQTRSA